MIARGLETSASQCTPTLTASIFTKVHHMASKLIIDVGMHKGEDTGFYLERGHKVVGVEANPTLVAELRSKFSSYISTGNLVIIDKAIAEEPGVVDFYINDQNSVWGSIDPAFVKRNARDGHTASQVIQVPCITMEDVVSRFPDPYYIKIDVEGMDLSCLRSLSRSACRPRYISIESSVSSPADRWSEELTLFQDMGYDTFKFVDQARLDHLNGSILNREGSATTYKHVREASGPFGEETPGEWMRVDHAASTARRLRREFETYSPMSSTPRPVVKMFRGLRKLRGLPVPDGWYDLHARHSSH